MQLKRIITVRDENRGAEENSFSYGYGTIAGARESYPISNL